jgi:signal transduction histidine kinase
MDAASRPKPRLLFLAPFLLLALLFAWTDLLAMRRVSQLRAETENVVQDMLTDVELVSRMRRDLDHVRILAHRYVFEKDGATLTALDAQIALTKADFAVAAAQYESVPMLPAEQGPWQALKGAIADIRPRLDAVLALARDDHEAAAQRGLVEVEGDFGRIDGHFRDLINYNHRSAKETVARVAALQRTSAASLQVLALIGVALSVALGAAMTRALQLRERHLREVAERLAASNRELDAFAGRVAHDLRLPLTTATLATSQLSKQPTLPEQTKALGILQRAFSRMAAIIQDLLAISRMQASAPVGVCDPASAAEELREELAPRTESGDVNLVIDVEHAKVRCSEGLFRQVMWNLAENAMKYRRAEVRARVEICGRAAEDRYELSVQDNGIGISPEEACKLFEPFYRTAGAKGAPGTGLGLSIVKRVVEANGGTVSVTSEPGSGSKFVTRLPLA